MAWIKFGLETIAGLASVAAFSDFVLLIAGIAGGSI